MKQIFFEKRRSRGASPHSSKGRDCFSSRFPVHNKTARSLVCTNCRLRFWAEYAIQFPARKTGIRQCRLKLSNVVSLLQGREEFKDSRYSPCGRRVRSFDFFFKESWPSIGIPIMYSRSRERTFHNAIIATFGFNDI